MLNVLVHEVDCKACWKQSWSPTRRTYGTFFHVGAITRHLHAASAGNIKKLLSADDLSVPTPLSFTSLQAVPIVPLAVSEKFASLFQCFRAEPGSSGIRSEPCTNFCAHLSGCWCCACRLPWAPSGACWWRECSMQAVAGSPKSRAGAGAWALGRDPQIRCSLKSDRCYFFRRDSLHLQGTSKSQPVLFHFGRFLAGSYAGTECSSCTAEQWASVLSCVGSIAICRREMLCSCTGWLYASRNSSVPTPTLRCCRHADVFILIWLSFPCY